MELNKYRVLVLLILVLACALIYRWTDGSLGASFFGYSRTSEQPQGQAAEANQALQDAVATTTNDSPQKVIDGSSALSELYSKTIKYSIRKQLSDSNFTELNAVLDKYLAATQQDIANERDLMTAYWAFELNDDGLADELNAWIKASPDSYQPYLASAFYYYRRAWDARGGKWASETKEEQLSKMNEYFGKVAANLDVVLNKNDQALPAYYAVIGMMRSSGKIRDINKVFSAAIKKHPYSYYLRKVYLESITPRWGGSYELMQQVIDDAQSYADVNPRLKLLNGYVYADAADMSKINRAYNEADKLYTTALSFGDNEMVVMKRGENNYRREQYQEALADLDKAISLYSEDADYYYWRAKTYINLGEFMLAADDIMQADLLKPGDEYTVKSRKWLAIKFMDIGHGQYEQQEHEQSIASLNRAVELDPDNAYLYYERSLSLAAKGNLGAAEQDLQIAISLNPDEYGFYAMIDYVLARKNDWDHIIAHWSRYIERHPKDGRAYVERGGAYYRKGDIKAAVRDAKTSADLGNPEGKAAYAKFGHLVK